MNAVKGLYIDESTKDMTTAEALADTLFSQFDVNNDGNVSWEEFKAGASRNQAVISLLEFSPDN